MRLLSSDCARCSISCRVFVEGCIIRVGVHFRGWYCLEDVINVEEEEGGG